MHKTTSIALALTLLAAAPATAQVSGSINRDAPTVSNTLTFQNKSMLQVKFTAIHFGEGQWQKILQNQDRHERFNSFAERRPIGSVKTNVEVTASGRKIPAGEYDMYFTAFSRGEQSSWVLNLKNKDGGDPIRWGMAMQDSSVQRKRMKISLEAGDKVGSCSITFAFGKKSVTVPLEVGAMAEKKEKAGEAIR